MELFVLFMIAAIGGFWWLNYIMKKNADNKAAEAKAEEVPYKVEPAVVAEPAPAPVVETAPAPVVETAPAVKKAKTPAKSKAVVKRAESKTPRAKKTSKA